MHGCRKKNSILTVCFSVIYFYCSKSQITVTKNRVYGNAAFGKRVDLPVDSISAVSIGGIFSQIAVATASGLIHFYLIKNHAEVHKTISDLLVSRQEKPNNVVHQVVNQTSATELKEYKELLDSGIISQEEFDAKKKQILGL